ncbi:glycosyltransferase [Paraburkholderia gardini]|uniref:glycosyltransferase n=1 Tax=Paraburkholderia gardini TaxID=2823469 RepID=UPI001E37DA2E|nr:glycosyltransferase [Paraburkholderia gardini]
MLQHRCSRYIVQTPSMAASLKRWLRYDVPVSVVPFTSDDHSYTSASDDRKSKFDFVYVASGESHKNHRNLLDAWRLLAEAGLRPSLTLTVDSSTYRDLSDRISWHIVQLGLNIVNVGPLQQSDIADLYRSSSALIFPSIIESFGLPLIEATRLGLPVIAAELDYVRDIVRPVETFDPHSPVSIARAVRRFMNVPDDLIEIHSPKQFLEEILR